MNTFIRGSLTVVAFFGIAGFAGGAPATSEPGRASDDAGRDRDLYIANCSACHQAGGDGVPGIFPPLKGSAVVNRDDAAKHIRVVLDGMQGAKVSGVVYAGGMPPFSRLSDAEIAAIINYERRSWGNHGQPVTAADIAAARQITKPRSNP